jgi:putative FmdB family regulatory protein
MPLYNYECQGCQTVFEVLTEFGTKVKVACERCGGESRRSEIAAFSILGSNGNGRASGKSGSDFFSNADTFVSAMNGFGDKIGDRLSNRQMERAVENLRKAKR